MDHRKKFKMLCQIPKGGDAYVYKYIELGNIRHMPETDQWKWRISQHRTNQL